MSLWQQRVDREHHQRWHFFALTADFTGIATLIVVKLDLKFRPGSCQDFPSCFTYSVQTFSNVTLDGHELILWYCTNGESCFTYWLLHGHGEWYCFYQHIATLRNDKIRFKWLDEQLQQVTQFCIKYSSYSSALDHKFGSRVRNKDMQKLEWNKCSSLKFKLPSLEWH